MIRDKPQSLILVIKTKNQEGLESKEGAILSVTNVEFSNMGEWGKKLLKLET